MKNSTIGINLRKYREKMGFTQESLSKVSGVCFHTIVKIESGGSCNPRVYTLNKLSNSLGITIEKLIN